MTASTFATPTAYISTSCVSAVNWFAGNNGIALCSLALAAATFGVNLYYKRKEYDSKKDTTTKTSAEPDRLSSSGTANAVVASATTQRSSVRSDRPVRTVSDSNSKPLRKPRSRSSSIANGEVSGQPAKKRGQPRKNS